MDLLDLLSRKRKVDLIDLDAGFGVSDTYFERVNDRDLEHEFDYLQYFEMAAHNVLEKY